MTALDGGGAEAAEAAHARLARGGADLRASLEAVAHSIRSIVARRPEPFAPAQPTIDEVPPCREPSLLHPSPSMCVPTCLSCHQGPAHRILLTVSLPDSV